MKPALWSNPVKVHLICLR